MQSMKNFLIALAAGVVVFGIFAYFVSKSIMNPQKNVENDVSPSGKEDTDVAEQIEINPYLDTSKTFTAVVGGYDADGSELDGLLFVKCDKENKRFVIASVPTALSVTVKSTDPATGKEARTNVRIKDFPKVYRESELPQKTVDTLYAMTGMKIDYYAFFDINSALALFDKTGGLYYEVPMDMYFVGSGTEASPEIDLKAGGKVLNSKEILQLLRFSYYTNDESRNNFSRAETQTSFIKEALLQIVKMDMTALIPGVAEILSQTETNLTISDITANLNLLLNFGEYSGNSVFITLNLTDPIDFSRSQKIFENYK